MTAILFGPQCVNVIIPDHLSKGYINIKKVNGIKLLIHLKTIINL